MRRDALYELPIFDGISGSELNWLLANSAQVRLDKAEYFTREHDPYVRFYVVLDGELQVSRTLNGTQTVLGTTPRGIIGGELSILNNTPSEVTVQAIMPSTLMVLEPDVFRALFSACPIVGTRILRTAAERMSGLAVRVTQQEKMAALGRLSAGLAHELNNPAAAARRSAQSLRESLAALQIHTLRLHACALTQPQLELLLSLQSYVWSSAGNPPALDPIERSDRESSLGVWLAELGIGDDWEIAPALVKTGIGIDDLTDLCNHVGVVVMAEVLTWLVGVIDVIELLESVEQSTRRISDLVGAIKEYTYMDRAPVLDDIDLHRGLDITLKVLNHKLKQINVIRDYASDLPKVNGNGSELNQVWTNLIDNAIDAMKGEGTLHIITRSENAFAMVEITDSGAGIPPEILPHVFEPFYTTKDVGSGTGLGLDIVYQIVRKHQATIEVQSSPGQTRFIVRLPISRTQ